MKRELLLSTVFFLLVASVFAQSPVKGVVKDSKGVPLTGVTVSVKGTKAITITNNEGSFSLDAKKGDVLLFSNVSFSTKEVVVTDASFYNVELAASTTTLGDVVVVGYGKSSRKTLSSAITTIKPDDLNRGAISDVGQLLQGKVPGLNITASGDPNRSAAVILRGASTLNSSQGPFYVIDGIP